MHSRVLAMIVLLLSCGVYLAGLPAGPMRLQVTPKNPATFSSTTATVQMSAGLGTFRGVATGSPGATRNISSSVQWSSSNPAIANIDASGLVSNTGAGGATTITAVRGPLRDSSTLTFPTFTCAGETYDVNNAIADGCEVADFPTGNHTQLTAIYRGAKPCTDGVSQDTVSGLIPSDSRQHVGPAISGFDSVVGAAPDWFTVFGTGGTFCINDFALTATTAGGGNSLCYRVSFITNLSTFVLPLSGNQTASMSSGGSSVYGTNTSIFIKIEKTCALPLQENVQYTISYHL